MGEAPATGVAIFPRNLVRTSWNGIGHLYRSSSARTSSSVAMDGVGDFVIGRAFESIAVDQGFVFLIQSST